MNNQQKYKKQERARAVNVNYRYMVSNIDLSYIKNIIISFIDEKDINHLSFVIEDKKLILSYICLNNEEGRMFVADLSTIILALETLYGFVYNDYNSAFQSSRSIKKNLKEKSAGIKILFSPERKEFLKLVVGGGSKSTRFNFSKTIIS